VSIPGAILDSSICFDPKRGAIPHHGLETRLRVDTIFVALDAMQSLLQSLMATQTNLAQGSSSEVPQTRNSAPSPTGSPVSDSRFVGAISVSDLAHLYFDTENHKSRHP
jgi:hypothetical protein